MVIIPEIVETERDIEKAFGMKKEVVWVKKTDLFWDIKEHSDDKYKSFFKLSSPYMAIFDYEKEQIVFIAKRKINPNIDTIDGIDLNKPPFIGKI